MIVDYEYQQSENIYYLWWRRDNQFYSVVTIYRRHRIGLSQEQVSEEDYWRSLVYWKAQRANRSVS